MASGSFFSSSTPSLFGGFGQQQQQQQQQQTPAGGSLFSTSAFGQPQGQAQTSAPSLFGGFGGQTSGASATPTFGTFGGGQQQQQATPAGGGTLFGSFGQPAQTTTTPSLFSGFGQQAAQQTSTAPTFGTFGAPQQSAATPSFGGFGAQPTTSTAPSLFGGFGQQQQTTTATPSLFGGFGATPQPATSQPSLFGSFGQQQQKPAGSLFGGFGTQQSQPSGSLFGGFGTGATNPSFAFPTPGQQQQPSLFGQPQGQPGQPLIDEAEAVQKSVLQCHKFGDERDAALAGLNYLQSCWGAGRGFYSQTAPPVAYSQNSPFFRFKAVGYAFLYTDNNEDGLVVLTVKKGQEQVKQEETTIINTIQQFLMKPNILIKFEGTKSIGEGNTMIVLFAEDKTSLRRVPATDFATALCNPMFKTQMENLGVTSVNPKVRPSPEQLKRYLEVPPAGIDHRVWKQAQEDNPDKSSMIPTPLVGVEAMKARIDWQEKETLQHHQRLKIIGDDVAGLMNKHANLTAELLQMKRKHVLLAHRLISIICRQELMRKQGTTLTQEEESLKRRLEEMDLELNSPTHYKGRLNELLSQIRLHRSTLEGRSSARYNPDSTSLHQLKEFMTVQQESVKNLSSTLRADKESVHEMNENINQKLKLPSS